MGSNHNTAGTSINPATAMDQDFENGIRILREAFTKKLSLRESEIVQLRGELGRKEAEVKDLNHRVGQLEAQVARGDKRIAEMSRAVSKLASFKQAVMDSLASDDNEVNDLKRIQASALSYTADVSSGEAEILNRSGDGFIGDSTTRLNRSSTSAYPGSPDRQVDDILGSFGTGKSLKNMSSSDNVRRQASRSPVPGGFNGRDSPSGISPTPGAKKSSGVSFSGLDSSGNENPLIRGAGGGSTVSYNFGLGASTSVGASQGLFFDSHGLGGDLTGQGASGSSVQSVDGREFFRNARAVLSYDDFTALLTNVKAYNAREQSKHRTLENLHGLLGDKNKQIYDQFERLLSR
ncbi:hypothetical protein BC829DRAFT_280984 [Chytridium lagenaria]|nr:hypothetical protein BC829DRAFT_280984 [Chytridium lagenaria]